MKVYYIPVVFLLFFCCQSISGQNRNTDIKKHTVYIDVSTRGPVYTINYDRIFIKRDKVSFSYRIGFFLLKDEIAMPLGISLITGKHDHHAEFSLTLTPDIDRFNYLFREGNVSDKYLYITPGFGYRYQKPEGGLFIKALVAPMILLDPPSDDFWNMDPKLYPLLTVGTGISF